MHTIHDKKLLARVRRISGQISALEKQLSQEGDCTAVLQQIAAIRGAVNGLMGAVIESHLAEHVIAEPAVAKRKKDLDAVLQVIKPYLK